jgi:hypothetical protein
MKELSDDICTVLSVSGSDQLPLSLINPTGTSNIYNFNYYLQDKYDSWIGKDVYAIDDKGNTRLDSNGNKILLKDYVCDWQEKIKTLIYSSNEEGSYAQLLSDRAYFNSQYNLLYAKYVEATTISNYLTEAISTFKEEEKTAKKTGWGMLLLGVALIAGAVGIFVATGGSGAEASAAMVEKGTEVLISWGAAEGTAATIASYIPLAISTTVNGLTTSGFISIGSALTTYFPQVQSIKITKDECQTLLNIANDNAALLFGNDNNGYVKNLDSTTAANAVGGLSTISIVNENSLYICGDSSGIVNLSQRKPDLNSETSIAKYYSMSVLAQKIAQIDAKIEEYVTTYGYNYYFSESERRILEPFLIQSEYTDEAFTATSDVTIDDDTDLTQYITTTQGVMTIQEFLYREQGYYFDFYTESSTSTWNANPVKFIQENFRNSVGADSNSEGTYILTYNGKSWDMTGSLKSSGMKIGNSVGILDNSSAANYSFVSGDYIAIRLYNPDIEMVNTTTIAMQLAQQAYSVIDTVSQPAFSFSMNTSNFVFQKEFTPWLDQIGFGSKKARNEYLGFGTVVNVELENGEVLQPFLQEIDIDYEDSTSIEMTFGNKFNLGTSEWTLGDLISENTSTINRVTRALIGTSSSGMSTSVSSISSDTTSTLQALNGATTQIVATQAEINSQIENNAETFAKGMANGMALYSTTKEEGTYFHDNENLEDSNTVYLFNDFGLSFTKNYNHGNTEWDTGISADGSMILHSLTVNQITADQISAGAIEADKIAANAITAGKISTNAIYADNLRKDAVFKLYWSNSSVRDWSTTKITNSGIDLNNFDGCIVFCSDYYDGKYIGSSSAIGVKDKTTAAFGKDSNGWYGGGTITQRGFTMRSDGIYMDNGYYFSHYVHTVHSLNWHVTQAFGIFDVIGDILDTAAHPTWQKSSTACVPQAVYVFRMGV